jgi:hypothetical protein
MHAMPTHQIANDMGFVLVSFRILWSAHTYRFGSTKILSHHTIVLEPEIFGTNKEKQHVKVGSVLCYIIITICGNDNIKHITH